MNTSDDRLTDDNGSQTKIQRCGYVAIVGRPNVGKSTLLNKILGQKLSITSRKPQTTRHQLLGIKTTEFIQVLYVDTPGLHEKTAKEINRYMIRSATRAIRDVDLIIFVVDRLVWNQDDELVLKHVQRSGTTTLLVVNKVDLLKDKTRLLPHLEMLRKKCEFSHMIPISAMNGHNLDTLESLTEENLPESHFYFPEDQITDRSQRFLVSEIIREKIMRQLGEELPYEITVQIESYHRVKKVLDIQALILVEREGQKGILIGKGGVQLRKIGTEARKDIESLLSEKTMLRLWVKVKTGWSDDERTLKSLGYHDL
ncbi:MAG: GTPase Era [Gammaproteobacteria bacterium]|nr:GTPase Era [Gammaproteobacteria bacterium]